MEKTESRNCLQCGTLFQASVRELKRGNAKFCSLKCSAAYHGKMRPVPEPNQICAWCGEPVYRTKSKLPLSKSGLYFCCRAHKDAAQRLGGIKEIMPPHYGTSIGKSAYRRIAFTNFDARCSQCGYHKLPVLQVHHIDGNHQNNDLQNLAILRPTCHEEQHYLAKTGRYASNK